MSKEKTREIKVWMDKDWEDLMHNNCLIVFNNKRTYDHSVEATLLIKEPEKTVAVTRDELYALWGWRDKKDFEAHVNRLFGSET